MNDILFLIIFELFFACNLVFITREFSYEFLHLLIGIEPGLLKINANDISRPPFVRGNERKFVYCESRTLYVEKLCLAISLGIRHTFNITTVNSWKEEFEGNDTAIVKNLEIPNLFEQSFLEKVKNVAIGTCITTGRG